VSLGGWLRERWSSRGRGPVQLDWDAVTDVSLRLTEGGRGHGKWYRQRQHIAALRAQGVDVVEIGLGKHGPVHVTWTPAEAWVPWVIRDGRFEPAWGKSVALHPAFVEARRVAWEDPASTLARGEFRPV
jgi:hypothetical protein